MSIKDYRNLVVWQKAMELVEAVYRLTRSFPKEEVYGLTSQLRRAAVSVPCNIAEGQGRRTTGDFLQFLSVARGSLMEVETQLMIAERLRFCTLEEVKPVLALAGDVGRPLSGLSKSLKNKQTSPRPNH